MVVEIPLPGWLTALTSRLPEHFVTQAARLQLVVELSQRNVQERTGGPFAAAVVERDSGKLVSLGVNRVVPTACSAAHAEIVALSLAQQKLGAYSLAEPPLREHELVVNWRPCAMCFGALPWSGIRSLLIAGSGPELEQLTGFDEGPIHPQWERELKQRGIAVSVGDSQAKAQALVAFRSFVELGNRAYNGR
jgi:tRNA(Arg) A34 adenosine deaminase TadA